MERNRTAGHLCALFTIVVWGATFISTKVLLDSFQPVEILFFRFVMGFVALTLAYPHRLKNTTARQELTFAAAGLCGVCLYYLMENIALSYTAAANVGVIVSASPFFTAILTRLTGSKERLGPRFFFGFIAAMAGIVLISVPGGGAEFNPLGDLLALLAAFAWGCYSVVTKRIGGYGYHTVLTTRRVFFYGLVFMLPALFLFGFSPDWGSVVQPVYLLNLLFLGLCASALCFVTWNVAVGRLGAIKTSVYIYLIPVVTLIASALILKERLTVLSAVGTGLTLAGLVISQSGALRKKGGERNAA